MLCHDSTDRVALTVVGLLTQQNEVGALTFERLGQRVSSRRHIRARNRRITEVNRAVGTERDGLVQRTHGAVRTHRYGHDLLDRDHAALFDLHRRLDGVRVIRVEILLAAAVHTPRRGVNLLLDGGIRDLLHQDAYLHSQATPWVCWERSYLVERLTDSSRSEEHTSELQSLRHLVCRLLLEKKK